MGWGKAIPAVLAMVVSWGSVALADTAAPVTYPAIYVVRSDHWSDADERDYSRFIAEIGDTGCHTVDACLHNVRNPFHGTDPAGVYFRSDCADLA